MRVIAGPAGILGIAAIGAFDYLSGTELRVYPLYYAPIGLLAWHFGRGGALVAAVLAAVTWFGFNHLAGMRFSSPWLWVANTGMHGTSFLMVGWLIALLRRAVARERDLSRTDSLTRLRNSRAFYEDTTPLLSLLRRQRRPLTLAYLDLDNFKSVNDTAGHQAGDALLRDVADVLRGTLRTSDISARLGGDEFAILLPELDETQAVLALERLRQRLSQAVVTRHGEVTASIGAVTFLAAPDTTETLVRHADALMYRAKAEGKNRLTHIVSGVQPSPRAP